MHLKRIVWFNLYNEIKLKKNIQRNLQNKSTKFILNINFKNPSEKKLSISQKIFLKKILLSKKKLVSLNFFSNFILLDQFYNKYFHSNLIKQLGKYNITERSSFSLEAKIKSSQYKNFSNRLKRIYSSLINI